MWARCVSMAHGQAERAASGSRLRERMSGRTSLAVVALAGVMETTLNLGSSATARNLGPQRPIKLACCFSLLLSFSGLPDAPPATPLSMRTWLSARVARFLWSHWAGNPGRVSLAPRLPTRHRLPTRFPLRGLRDLRLAHHPRSLRSRFRARPRQPCRDGVPRVAQREPAGSPRALNKSVPAAACPFPTLMLAAKRAVAVTAAGPGRCPSRGYGPCWPTAAPRPRRFFT